MPPLKNCSIRRQGICADINCIYCQKLNFSHHYMSKFWSSKNTKPAHTFSQHSHTEVWLDCSNCNHSFRRTNLTGNKFYKKQYSKNNLYNTYHLTLICMINTKNCSTCQLMIFWNCGKMNTTFQRTKMFCCKNLSLIIYVVLLLNGRFFTSLQIQACVPDRAGSFYLSYSSGYFQSLQSGQCAVFGFADEYCTSTTNTCARKCSTDQNCQFYRADGSIMQQHCRAVTETAVGPFVSSPSTTTNLCQCLTSSECSDGETCLNGACVCKSDSDCQTGKRCYFYGISWDDYYKNQVKRPQSKGSCLPDLASALACNGQGKPNNKFTDPAGNSAAPSSLTVPNGDLSTSGYCRCYR